jgi:integrase
MSEYLDRKIPGCEWLRWRNGIAYIKGPENGYVARSLRTRDDAEAVKLYHEQMGKPQVQSAKLKHADAWERFLSDAVTKDATRAKHRSTYTAHIKPLVHGNISNFTREFSKRVLDVAEAKVSDRTGKPLSISMLRSVKAALGAFGEYCLAEEWLVGANPAQKLPARSWFTGSSKNANTVEHREVEESEVLTDAEIAALTEACGDYADRTNFTVRMFVQLMPLIGTRINECLALRVDDILDHEDGRYGTWGSLYVDRQIRFGWVAGDTSTWFDPILKHGGKARRIPLTERSRTLLDTYIERGLLEGWLQAGGLLFPTRNGTPIQSSWMSGRIGEAVDKVGLDVRGITSHNFRHTYASKLFAKDVDVAVIARLIGNDPRVTEQVYVHFIKQGALANYIAAAMSDD